MGIKPEELASKIDTTGKKTFDFSFKELEKVSLDTESQEEIENANIIKMRSRWSNWVLTLIVLIVIFDMAVVGLVGGGVWKFTNTSIVIAVITDNFLKIVGLGYLITAEIFKKIYPRK